MKGLNCIKLLRIVVNYSEAGGYNRCLTLGKKVGLTGAIAVFEGSTLTG